MKIRYLGTAAAEGFPAVFCNCEACSAARRDLPKEMRTRSQAAIDGDLLIDFPPESYLHAMRFGLDLSGFGTLLVTHSHTDHFYAQEFCNRGYKFARGMRSRTIEIYGNAEVGAVLEEGARREMRPAVREGIAFRPCAPYEEFFAGGYRILTLPARHSDREQALLFYIQKGSKALLWLNDSGPLYEEIYPFLAEKGAEADLVSFDCTFADEAHPSGQRHMNIFQNMDAREKLIKYGVVKKDAKYYVTHFSHNCAPFRARMDALAAKYGFSAAFDGCEAEI